jgi:hypothetical protein
METEGCVRCGRELKTAKTINQTADPSVAIYLSAVTTGLRPRLRTHYQRGIFCTRCAVSVAYGPAPEGDFNLKIYRMLGEMIELDQDESLTKSARILLLHPDAVLKLMPGSKPDESLSRPILKIPALAG